MPFPTSPTNGQLTTVNGITYVYSSASTSWKKIISSVGNLTVTNTLTINTFAINNLSTTGNITTSNNISASGNITANYFIGDGSSLTNLRAASTGKAIAMSIVFGG